MFDRPPQPKGRTRWLTHEEVESFLAAVTPHERPFAIFLFGTGCRLSEALHLDWHEVDLARGQATIIGRVDDDDDEYGTKNGKARTVPLHSRIISELEKFPHRTGPVFRKSNGEPYVAGRHFPGVFATACRRAGLKPFTPHVCRHTWATWYYLEHPGDLFSLMELGGWSSIEMVKRYAHVDASRLAPKAMSALSAWDAPSARLRVVS
jgi:integrase